MASRKRKKNWDPGLFAMSPERLQEHLQLRTRARRIPDKKKQANKMACRRSASGHWPYYGIYYFRIRAGYAGFEVETRPETQSEMRKESINSFAPILV